MSEAPSAASVYDISVRSLIGETVPLRSFVGKVLLVVNTASRCGFTPQYAGLQALHERFAPRGLVVMGFPCNQFGAQEPADEAEIGRFCQSNYGVDFFMAEKVSVNGEHAHPLFRLLTSELPGILGTQPIKWNFTKFLLDRSGMPVKRYAPTTTPAELAADIEALLGSPA